LLWSTTSALGLCVANGIATDGRSVVLAENAGGPVPFDFQSEAFDAATGEPLWRHDPARHAGFDDFAVAVDTEHRLSFVVGREVRFLQPPPSFHGLLVVRAYDTRTGVLRWEDQYPLNPACDCTGLDVVAVKGQVFVVGRRSTGDWIVRAYDSRSGDLLWQDESAPAGSGSGLTAVAADRGRVFVAGSALNAAGNLDFILRTYDAK
jgi:outer membrane protein assembly factor BamB